MSALETSPARLPFTERFVSIDEVADFLDVNARTIRRLVDRGEFPRPVPMKLRGLKWPGWEVAAWSTARMKERGR